MKPIFVRHEEIAAALQGIESGEQARLWGVPVLRVSYCYWRFASGGPLLLLPAIDRLMGLAGFAAVVEIELESVR
jgi:hypothetical protein